MGWIKAMPQVLRDLGCDPARMLAASGIEPTLFDDERNSISFQAVGRLFEHVKRAAECPHFALLVGERFEPELLGETARLMGSSATVGDALQTLILWFHVLDEGAVPMLLPVTRGRATLAHVIYAREVPTLDQFADLAASIAVKLMKGLCGSAFQPLRVTLPHRPPADPGPYQRLLGSNVTFNGTLTAVTFSATWLAEPVLGGSGLRPAEGEAFTDGERSSSTLPLSHQLRRALRPMLFTGTASETQAARLFGLHPRSLRRRLREEGTSFHGLLGEARLAVAQQLLRDTNLRIAEVAATLRYSDVTAFSRAFRAQAGTSPMQWRQRERRRASVEWPAATF